MFNFSPSEWLVLGGLLVLVVAGIFAAIGVFQARSLVRRELSAYFLSPIAYAVFAVFLAVTGHLFYLTLTQLTASGPRGTEDPLQFMFGDDRFWLVFLFIPPLLTMRSFAEERSTGTLETLMTAPLTDWQVVASKFVACFAFYLLLWLPTVVYLPVLLDIRSVEVHNVWTLWSILFVAGLVLALFGLFSLLPRLGTTGRLVGVLMLLLGIAAAVTGGVLHYRNDAEHLLVLNCGIDPAPVLSTYLGMALAGAMFLALGLFVSSLVRDQLVAALLALALSLLFIVAGFWRPDMDSGGAVYQVVYFFSVPLHFQRTFTRGLIDSRHVVLYVSVALFFLFLTVRSLESRRWR
jgi:ABC-type transport system involved in multi-copper enzyme maturation permease subunit